MASPVNHFSKPPVPGVRAVIFDISGTVVDFGCHGPVAAFVELFARHRVNVSVAEVREPMGAHKRDHIWKLLSDPAIASRWETAHGVVPTRALLDQLCAEFVPLQVEILARHCELIPGAAEVAASLRQAGIKVANTTGFESGMIEHLVRSAEAAGYVPDLWVCSDQVGQGRPAPWMIFHAARHLNVYPLRTFVKVGDTPADIAEGHAAGTWVVAVVASGNEVGCSAEELAAWPAAEREARLDAARRKLAAARPHYLIDTVADLMPVIREISARIDRGEMPSPHGETLPVHVEDRAALPFSH